MLELVRTMARSIGVTSYVQEVGRLTDEVARATSSGYIRGSRAASFGTVRLVARASSCPSHYSSFPLLDVASSCELVRGWLVSYGSCVLMLGSWFGWSIGSSSCSCVRRPRGGVSLVRWWSWYAVRGFLTPFGGSSWLAGVVLSRLVVRLPWFYPFRAWLSRGSSWAFWDFWPCFWRAYELLLSFRSLSLGSWSCCCCFRCLLWVTCPTIAVVYVALLELLFHFALTMDDNAITYRSLVAPGASVALSRPLLRARALSLPSAPLAPLELPPPLPPAPEGSSRRSPASLAVSLFRLASSLPGSPSSPGSGLFVTPGPPSVASGSPGPPRSPSPPAGSVGVAQLTPWEQATLPGGPVPSVRRQRTFDQMKAVEESGAERPPGSECSLCASTGARCFVSGSATTRKCSFCVYKALPCSLVSSSSPFFFLLS